MNECIVTELLERGRLRISWRIYAMADPPPKVYWDTSVFICLLNNSELNRHSVCEHILYEDATE